MSHYYMTHDEKFIRLKGDLDCAPIRKVWPFEWPKRRPGFELTLEASEVDREFVGKLMDFALAYADGVAFEWPAFSHHHQYPEAAWSKLAEERQAVIEKKILRSSGQNPV